MKKLFFVSLAVVSALSFFGGTLSAAEPYPNKPITFLVPWGTGGMTDVTARLLAEKFRGELGQPVLVVNKPGANGAIGLKYALSQKADGYTVVLGPMTDALSNSYFQDSESINIKDLSFAGGYLPQERVLYTTPDKPYKTFREFIDYAKENPGQISAGSGGSQWALEIVKSIAVKDGLKMKYVMFKSGGEASTAILGKHVDICETGTGTPAFQAARGGKLNLLVNLGSGTVPYFPNAKSVKQLGYPYISVVYYGFSLRAGTPEDIRKKLEDTLKKVLQDPEVKEKTLQMGLTPQFADGKAYEKIVTEAVSSVPELLKYNKAVQ
ncbi:MAG: tripartite tricarboxylate transporter substrate binding protein [Deltaproteobacteria bacterium]|nr:tripartite tricarboxylate transporter substrate binding protein [Deltaproteobacteria bacterium]